MGFWSDLTGKGGADTARNAAADKEAKQIAAAKGLEWYGDDYRSAFDDLSTRYDPYVQTGLQGNSALQNLLQDPSSLRSLPGYQFAFDEGNRAVDRSAAARSGVMNGQTIKAQERFGTGLADQTYGSQLQRLMALTQQGIGATGQQVGTAGQGLQGQLQTRVGAANIMNGAAGTHADGMVAAQNSHNAGTQNILDTGMKIAGMFGGQSFGGGGSSFAGQSSFGGPSGNWVDPDSGMGGIRRLFG